MRAVKQEAHHLELIDLPLCSIVQRVAFDVHLCGPIQKFEEYLDGDVLVGHVVMVHRQCEHPGPFDAFKPLLQTLAGSPQVDPGCHGKVLGGEICDVFGHHGEIFFPDVGDDDSP